MFVGTKGRVSRYDGSESSVRDVTYRRKEVHDPRHKVMQAKQRNKSHSVSDKTESKCLRHLRELCDDGYAETERQSDSSHCELSCAGDVAIARTHGRVRT